MKRMPVLLVVMIMVAGLFLSKGYGESNARVTVYYFHTTARCMSCHNIEGFTRAAINEAFADELSSGKLEFRMINTDKKENRHYVSDYGLYTKSVVLALVKDGREQRFKNLEKVWPLLGDMAGFYQYIQEETQGFLDQLEGEKK
ncbi:MAG: nitrophenyl compound nitroreductase subunit ArsF family protein [Candidatus Omnitrophota bacterium]